MSFGLARASGWCGNRQSTPGGKSWKDHHDEHRQPRPVGPGRDPLRLPGSPGREAVLHQQPSGRNAARIRVCDWDDSPNSSEAQTSWIRR